METGVRSSRSAQMMVLNEVVKIMLMVINGRTSLSLSVASFMFYFDGLGIVSDACHRIHFLVRVIILPMVCIYICVYIYIYMYTYI